MDLKADELKIRTAGQPASTFPCSSFPSQSTSLHDVPKAGLMCFPNVLTSECESCGSSKMHVSV